MGHINKNKKDKPNESFPYKTLLIFSGLFWCWSGLCMSLIGKLLNIFATLEYNTFTFFTIAIPFLVHIYLWGKFCEWKKARVLSMLFKYATILVALAIPIVMIAYVVQKVM